MKGTYILIFCLLRHRFLKIGRLGEFNLTPGFYTYVGSAFGTGGLAARINHHVQSTAKPRWHVDYLRGLMKIEEVWLSNGKSKHEHEWA